MVQYVSGLYLTLTISIFSTPVCLRKEKIDGMRRLMAHRYLTLCGVLTVNSSLLAPIISSTSGLSQVSSPICHHKTMLSLCPVKLSRFESWSFMHKMSSRIILSFLCSCKIILVVVYTADICHVTLYGIVRAWC